MFPVLSDVESGKKFGLTCLHKPASWGGCLEVKEGDLEDLFRIGLGLGNGISANNILKDMGVDFTLFLVPQEGSHVIIQNADAKVAPHASEAQEHTASAVVFLASQKRVLSSGQSVIVSSHFIYGFYTNSSG